MGRPLRLLIVDDSEEDARRIVDELRRGGYEPQPRRVETVPELQKALEEESWDLVLAELELPKFSGFSSRETVWGILNAGDYKPPLIIISRQIDDERAAAEINAGVADCLHKDRLARLTAVVGRELRQAEVRRDFLQASDAVKSSERRYRRVTEAVTDYIYSVSVENGEARETIHSPACEAVTGHRAEEFAADPYLWLKMVHEEDRPLVVKQAADILAGREAKPLDHRIFRKDGAQRWVRNTPVPQYDRQGSLISYDGLARDITEHRRLEDQLRQAQKMEAVGQLAGGVAHDFNNLLQAIMGHTQLAREAIGPDHPSADHVTQVLAASEKAASLTRQLLAFSRRQLLQPSYLDLNQVISELLKMLRRLIGEDIELRVTPGENLHTVHADPGQLQQILMNLCVNSRDAMPAGGVIAIATENVTLDANFCEAHPWAAPGDYALLTLSDTGSGMPQEVLAHVFEPFFTTKEVGKGTGLGLSMVYGIVKQHNGLIHLYSEPEKGTIVRLYLPAAERQAAKARAARKATVRGGSETILVAEDDETIRSLARRLLEKAGYAVVAAADGQEAVEVFAAQTPPVDLALLDVVMPRLSGRSAYERIREIRPGVPVLFCSGYSTETFHTEFISREQLQIIQKPYRPDDLLRKVREMLDNA